MAHDYAEAAHSASQAPPPGGCFTLVRRLALVLVLAGCAAPPAPRPELPTHVTTSTTAEPPHDGGVDVAPPPPAPYDLVADRSRIVDLAKTELGPSVPTTVVQGAFVLVAAPGWNESALAASTSTATRAIDAYFNGRFDTRPTRAVAVYLFPDGKAYQTYCRTHLGGDCISVFGFYRPDLRRIIMNAGSGLGTLTHELVHPIVEADFPGAPTWIDEGIASLFEAPVIPRDGEIHGVKNWRLPRLMTGMSTPKEQSHARLDALFGMANETFRGDLEKLHYATARYVCQWLDERGLLWPLYRRWRDGVKDDPTGEKTFIDVVGMTPTQANAAWTAWAKKL